MTMKRALLALTALAGLLAAAPSARAQTFAADNFRTADLTEGGRFKTTQRFAFELRFGPYLPDVDSEFNGTRYPYRDYYGSDNHLLTATEFDYEILHRFGTVAVGAGLSYYSVSANSPETIVAALV